MNKAISLLIIAATASATAYAASSQSAYAPPGLDNIAFGYGAGYQSSGANTNIIVIGTDSGMLSANNRDCVFIGANAGKGMSGKSGAVVIGDGVFVHTNGVTTIKNFKSGTESNVVEDIAASVARPIATEVAFSETMTNTIRAVAGGAGISISSVTNSQGNAVFSWTDSSGGIVDVLNESILYVNNDVLAEDFKTHGSGTEDVSLTGLNTQVQNLKKITLDAYWSDGGMPTGSVLKVMWSGVQIGTVNFNNTTEGQ